MSIKVMSRIWESGPESLTDRFVLLAIADYANDEGEAWPSVAGIMRKTTLSERGVQTTIRRLEANGWLAIQTGNGRKGCNNYTIKTPQHMHPAGDAPPQMKAETPHMTAQNPAAYAPEPSRTVIEPSVVADKPAPKPKQSRKCRLPDGWTLSPQNNHDAEKAGLAWEEVVREEQQFIDYHRSHASTMADWDAAWRTWCRNAIKFAAKRGGTAYQKPESDLDRIGRMADNFIRKENMQ
jgi:hypothetical protein